MATDSPIAHLQRPAPTDLLQRLPTTLRWVGAEDGHLELLDQTLLPARVEYRTCRTAEQAWQAIRELCVRGAPAIGVAAGYGLCLGTREARTGGPAEFQERLDETAKYLCAARPTAVNLRWAVERVSTRGAAALQCTTASAAWSAMLDEAQRLAREDIETCRRIGEAGAALVPDGGGVLTHCNAGSLATVAYGTALSVLYVAHERGRRFRVFADETRPLWQGARLTAFELQAAGLDVTVLCDNAAATLMASGAIQMVIVGADRIAANGDAANKIGTYGVAILARHHRIPFYVAAPLSTFDPRLNSGEQIPIEQRAADEVSCPGGRQIVPAGVACYNPAFDVTPAELITGIITEEGLTKPVSAKNLHDLLMRGSCTNTPRP